MQITPRKTSTLPEWFPAELAEAYGKTDLAYSFCLPHIANLEAAKRDKIPEETLRVWFMEFIRMGWTKAKFLTRLNALMTWKTYGAVSITDWTDATEMFTREQMNLEIERIINNKIKEAEMLKAGGVLLTPEQETYIRLLAAKKFLSDRDTERREKIEEGIQRETERLTKALNAKKLFIANMDISDKMKLLDALINDGVIKCEKQGFEYGAILHSLESWADKIDKKYLEGLK